MSNLESAACAYVLARESGRPRDSLYRALRRAWIAKVRADNLELAKLVVKPKAHADIEWEK